MTPGVLHHSAAVAALLGMVGASGAGLTYSFDSSAQGWSSINDTSELAWDGGIGNPPGALRGVDAVTGDIWYFSAPADGLGNLAGLYGEPISYDILGVDGDHNDIANAADIMITSGKGGIGIDLDVQPVNGQWTSWSAVVDESAAWKVLEDTNGGLSDIDATEEDIRFVLGATEGLFIRGEYTTGSDATAIDNVNFVPGPGSAIALGLAGIWRRRRRAGQSGSAR